MANKITVTSAGTIVNANVTPDSAMYYSNKSKEWATSNKIVDNTDYSSKYYANESKKQADISTAKATEVVDSGNTAVSNIENARDNAITDIANQESLSVDNVNTAGVTQVANINSAGTTQINLAKEQVTLATNQANIATEQATIATNKASEVVASGNEALSNIDTAKNNAITSITTQETTSKTSLIDEGATQIGLIQNEGATQVANVQSTGFYMRDDKLYYINSQGEETEFKLDDIELNNPFSLFDSKYSDHELNNLSWLKSEGQWNAKAVYPDAYDKLLKVYNGTETVEGLSVKLSTETYTDYDFVLNTADETFRLPLSNNQRFVIETGNGYRIWSDGYVHQWGRAGGNGATVSLLKTLKDTKYQINLGGGNSYRWGVAPHSFTFYNVTASSFQIRMEEASTLAGGMNCYWDVYGYLAEGEYTPPKLYFYVGETVQNANLIDAGRIGEVLANKIGRTECKAYITETYVNGTSWYRVWSDGWCEQGGKSLVTGAVTINLLKKFANTNYTASASLIGTDGAYLSRADATLSTFTPSSFKVDYKSTNPEGIGTAVGYFWQVSGYIK